MVVISPFTTIFWVIFCSLYFMYKKKYVKLLAIWGGYFLVWYLIVITCLVGYPLPSIIVGGQCTAALFEYLDNRSFFLVLLVKNVCVETFVAFHFLADYYNTTIWIPSVHNGLFALVKFIISR